MARRADGAAKRAFDVVAASAALVVLAPLMALVALAVLVADGRPIFFGHTRVGRDGRRFACLKFRTMVDGAEARLAEHLAADPEAAREYALRRKLARDPRVLPLGRLLRKLSIDELPQLWNVLRGEMSLVGPRPATPGEIHEYGSGLRRYASVRPGITGLWQVSGRASLSFADRVRLDLAYVSGRSFLGDMAILARTPAVILRRNGAS